MELSKGGGPYRPATYWHEWHRGAGQTLVGGTWEDPGGAAGDPVTLPGCPQMGVSRTWACSRAGQWREPLPVQAVCRCLSGNSRKTIQALSCKLLQFIVIVTI